MVSQARLPFAHKSQEQLAISTSEVTITAGLLTISNVPQNIRRATIQHIAGGNVYHTTNITTPSNTGANGELKMLADDIWLVEGREDIENWSAIIASGEADATLQVELSGDD